MKRVLVLAILPMVLFGLETVNLIRNAGFERDEVWIEETGGWDEPVPAKANSHDDTQAFEGEFSGSADTRELPSWIQVAAEDSAVVRQEFLVPKKVEDLDSLHWYQAVRLISLENSAMFIVGFTYAEPERNGCGYGFVYPGGGGVNDWLNIAEEMTNDTTWKYYKKDLNQNLIVQLGVDPEQELASFVLVNWGIWMGTSDWWGQKTYIDNIRLIGWADYDVALTRLTGTLAQPAAMVWNNGREDQTDVIVIATIEGGEPYADTVILPSLASDDSTEVTFKEFGPISPSDNHYLTIVTGNFAGMLDECDENDVLYEEYLGVTESDLVEITLKVRSIASPLCVSYSLPYGESGTLTLYDATGRRIERMTVTRSGSVEFSSALASGIYFVRLETPRLSITRKAVVVR
jgi:hypothetical protein